jgi:hypothetical protein
MTILTPLILQPLPDRKWKLAADFSVVTDTVGPMTVPAGFVTDLSSIPRFLWWESTPSDYPEAGVLHDYCYDHNRVPRAVADKLYREVVTYLNAGRPRSFARYWALRVFGGIAYRNDAATARPAQALPQSPQP